MADYVQNHRKRQHRPVADKLLIPEPPSDIFRVGTWGVIARGCSEFTWIRYNAAKIIRGGGRGKR